MQRAIINALPFRFDAFDYARSSGTKEEYTVEDALKEAQRVARQSVERARDGIRAPGYAEQNAPPAAIHSLALYDQMLREIAP